MASSIGLGQRAGNGMLGVKIPLMFNLSDLYGYFKSVST